MQAVTILTDDSFQDTFFHQLHEHHVSGRRDGLSGALGFDVAATRLPVCMELPYPRAYKCDQLRAHRLNIDCA